MKEAKDRIIHLGTVKWFGGFNNKTGDYNRYGFLEGGIYFSASAFISEYRDDYIEDRLENVPVLYYLRKEDDERPDAGWVKLVREISPSEMIDLYNTNESVRKAFEDPRTLLMMTDLEPIQSVFLDVVSKTGIHPFAEAIRVTPRVPVAAQSFIADHIPWGKVPKEDAVAFFLAASDYCREKTVILKALYPSWTEDERIIKDLKTWYFPDCLGNETTEKDIPVITRLLEKVSDPEIRKQIILCLPPELSVYNPEYRKRLPDKQIAGIIREHFDPSNENSMNMIKELIPEINPSSYPYATIALGERMLACGMPLNVWKQLQDTLKVWFILYLSTHLPDAEAWKRSFGEIYKYEHSSEKEPDYCILAAIAFLTVALVDDSRKQEFFDKGHSYLEQAIIRDYEQERRPSEELMQLLCRCKVNHTKVCAARSWKSKNTIWCSTERNSCGLFSREDGTGTDFKKTEYAHQRDYHCEDALGFLSLADLLASIGFVPSLESIYSPMFSYSWDFVEYPYRIGGRIVQLNRLFSHMHCECGKVLKSNYGTSVKIDARMAITQAYCPDSGNHNAWHDKGVYLNECWNCNEVIDSRECILIQTNDGRYCRADETDIKGYYVCMRCGAGVRDLLPAVCPKCGCTKPEQLTFRDISQNPRKRRFESCTRCGYSVGSFRSIFEQEYSDGSPKEQYQTGFTATEEDKALWGQ